MRTKMPEMRQRRILTPGEKDSINERISDRKEDMSGGESQSHYIGDRANDPAEAATDAREKRVLRDGEPDSLNKNRRAELEKASKRDEEWMQKSMVPKSHIHMRPGPEDTMFRKCVNEMAGKENSPEFQKVAERWKNDQRQLGRESNLERIRPASR